ncbi:MAG: ATP-dependent DNA helicase RecQ [Candidatus Izimaplasma bacterium HR2]|nr:MAG: ATP-dependent DNA helicase RecQ [Candidatus Izimaplasma bacterium HR2]
MVCPKCGNPMVERIARRGKNIGNEFWGCSNYPKCKHAIDIRNGKESKKTNKDNTIISKNIYQIKPLFVRPKTLNHEVYFFNSLGVSESVLRELAFNESLEMIYPYSKFRIDIKSTQSKVDPKRRQIYSLLLRLLNRGRVTINSLELEKRLQRKWEINKCNSNTIEILDNFIDFSNVEKSVDSELEKNFIDLFLKEMIGSNWASHVLTQVEISSLIESNDFDLTSQRVDFLVNVNNKNIVIELDGEEHLLHLDKDRKRDQALKNAGYQVFRIKNEELNKADSEILTKLKNELKVTSKVSVFTKLQKYHIAMKVVHQLQITLLKALEQGSIVETDAININLQTDAFSKEEINYISRIAIGKLKELFGAYSEIYDFKFELCLNIISNSNEDSVEISFGNSVSTTKQIIISDIAFRDNYFCDINSFDAFSPKRSDEESLKLIMNYIYRFTIFQEGQFETIQRVIDKKDSIVLLPTGSGKSLIYQLTSLIIPGQTIVVSPITSLMDDQLDNLLIKGIDNTVAIYSVFDKATRDAKLNWMKSNNVSLVYLSPERLQMKSFRDEVKAQLVNNSVFTVAIDEAHCVSEWGHDFRTAYLNIGKNARTVFMKNNEVPLILALTGTASTAVLKDVQREISITDFDAIITPQTFDRKELIFSILSTSSDSKSILVSQVIKTTLPQNFGVSTNKFLNSEMRNPYCGIVFCPHVNGDYGVFPVSQDLSKTLRTTVGFYAGSAPKNFDKHKWNSVKKNTAIKFKRDHLKLLVATKAFGMGIDKPNIRYTIHYGIPGSIESFYQEAGRAGRDRSDAHCVIVFSNDNERRNNHLLDVNTSLDEIKDYIKDLKRDNADDISRMLFFHVGSFRGIDEELNEIEKVVEVLFSSQDNNQTFFTITTKRGEARNDLEKAIQRLVVLGIINDYTVDYSSNEYIMAFAHSDRKIVIEKFCAYVRGYNEGRVKSEKLKAEKLLDGNDKNFIMHMSRVLLEFIYDTIERGRRRGIREMVQLSQAALKTEDKDKVIRERVVRYFESTFSELITEILNTKDAGFPKVIELFEGDVNEVGERIGGIKSHNDAAELRGQVSRELESTPDHPGLLFLRSMSELYSKEYDEKAVMDDFIAGIKFSKENYSIGEDTLLEFTMYVMKKIFQRNDKLYYDLVLQIEEMFEIEDLYYKLSISDVIEDDMRDFPLLLHVDNQSAKLNYFIKGEK